MSLDQYVERSGETMSGGHAHEAASANDSHSGGHGGSHGDEPDFNKMDPNAFVEYVAGLHKKNSPHYIHKHEDRVKAVATAHSAFARKHSQRLEALLQDEVTDKIKLKDKRLKAVHNKVKDIYKDKVARDEDHTPEELDDLAEDLAEIILPEVGFGQKGHKKQNYKTLKAYLGQMGKDGEKLFQNMYGALMSGDGERASQSMLEIIAQIKVGQYHSEVNNALLNPTNKRFVDVYSKHMAEKVKEEMGTEVSIADIVKDYVSAAQTFAQGGYLQLKQQHRYRREVANDANYHAARAAAGGHN